MKHRLPSALLVASALLLGGLALVGCQSNSDSPALKRGATAAGSIQTAADTILAARAQINTTLAALRNLTERPGDIPAQYATVREQLAALRASSAKITAAADTMRSKGDAYLADWARQVAAIGDETLRSTALDRRADTAAKLQEIYMGFQKAKGDFSTLETSLRDIERALGADLSAKGIEVVRPFVQKATEAAEPVKATLAELASDFRDVGLTLQTTAK
jgi:hypothetical protein